MAIPEPFNPYIMPVDRSPRGWGRWGVQAFVLSLVATLIWDRGTSIRPEVKGQVKPLAAPAQWASAVVLVAGSLAAAVSLGLPWGAIPFAGGFAVLTRRILAAEGVDLTLEAATHQLVRKVLLAGLGFGVWWASIILGAWARSVTSTLTSNPLAKFVAGATAAEDLKNQAAGAAHTIMSAATVTAGVLIFISILWWSQSAYVAAMDAVAADETSNV